MEGNTGYSSLRFASMQLQETLSSPYPTQLNFDGTQYVPYATQPLSQETQYVHYDATQHVPYATQPLSQGTQPVPYATQPLSQGTQPVHDETHPSPQGTQPFLYGMQHGHNGMPPPPPVVRAKNGKPEKKSRTRKPRPSKDNEKRRVANLTPGQREKKRRQDREAQRRYRSARKAELSKLNARLKAQEQALAEVYALLQENQLDQLTSASQNVLIGIT